MATHTQVAVVAAFALTSAALVFSCASNEPEPAQAPAVAAVASAPPPPAPAAEDGPDNPTPTPSASPRASLPHQRRKNLPPVGPTVALTLDGKSVDVNLGSLGAHDGGAAPSLAQVWKSGYPSVDPASLHFDLVGSDGFHASSRPRCSRLLSGSQMSSAHLDPTTHNVSFDPGVEVPHCFHVLSVVTIDATR